MTRRHRFVIAVAAAVNLALPLSGVRYALPFYILQHEQHIVHRTLAMAAARDLDPGIIVLYGQGLVYYPLLAAYGLYYLVGRAAGWFADPLAFGASFLLDPSPFLVIGRVLQAAVSTAALVATAAAAARWISPAAGAWTAVLYAALPVHVAYARAPIPDAYAALLAALALLAWIRRPEQIGLAAFLGGLAAAAKWPGGAAVALPFTEAVRRRSPRAVAVCFAATAAGFFAATPYLLLRAGRYLALLRETRSEYGFLGETVIGEASPVPMHLRYLTDLAPEGLTFGGIALVVWGAAALVRRDGPRRLALLAPWAVYVGFLGLGGYPLGYRDMVMPFLLPYAGAAVAGASGRARWAACLLAGAMLLESGVRDARAAAILRPPADTAVVVAWIERNVPTGSRIVFLDDGLLYRLRNTPERALEMAGRAEERGDDHRAVFFRFEADWVRARPDVPAYDLVPAVLPFETGRHSFDQRLAMEILGGALLSEADPDALVAGADYLLLQWRPAEGNAAVLALRRAGEARGRLVWRWESVRTPGQIVEVWKVSG